VFAKLSRNELPIIRRRYHSAVPPTPVDPWTAFLQWLSTIIIPDWNGLIALLPILLILGVVGPGLTLLALYWTYVRLSDRRGRVRTDDPQPIAIAANAEGTFSYPPNAPYCPTHHLVYPPTVRECDVDRQDLRVRCPVDDTVRPAGESLCRTCGTRYQLGASLAPIVVRRRGTPPAGGAAVA
jgi:hypothetical protein